MSGLFIKGAEMPRECVVCPCEHDMECQADENHRRRPADGRPKWCPLVELEPVYKKDGRRYIFAMWAEVPKHYPEEGRP